MVCLISCSDHHFLGEFNTINSRDEIKKTLGTCAKDVSKNGLQVMKLNEQSSWEYLNGHTAIVKSE
jgi:hypothetical protein